ncbi:hypothetical protein CH354_18135 [Leptospira levettii]|uniref:hypothetical protein n=1 Tax=Leptospira levettii TaxID=2023178 RepID=UPI000C2AC097|nr:hypothetical protein [Leptospira levettii]MCW7475477.1 hypothetical protein [Leptospira levettii]PJZ35643.1 hypothetical protein CH354_18135 [Leptospira levettii]PJZ88751.1 hypothetical protein CH368_10075 [Leptospira levettii]PKA00739.1 hypothetical protein CH369_09900 [Leptospira levettii]TGM33939.1 hypothetical protein EHQ71_00180 [Leptospira levettii]
MASPNNTLYQTEFSERIRTFLLLSGIQSEYNISNTLSQFFQNTNLSYEWDRDWSLWMGYVNANKISTESPLPFPNRAWQFGSMVPKDSDWKTDPIKSKESIISSFKPIFVLVSIFLWSALYYLIIFRLL